MSPLEHAEAHERLADLAIEPGALDRLGSPDSDPLAAHVEACEACRSEVEAWRATHARLVAARGPIADRVDLAQLARDEPIAAPPEVRDAVLARVRRQRVASRTPEAGIVVLPSVAGGPETGAAGVGIGAARAAGRSRQLARRLLPLVAVLAIVAVGAGILLDQAGRLDRAGRQIALLEGMTASLDRVLNDPDHTAVDLRTADGSPAGTLAWSRHDLVVLTTALQAPSADRVYRCWIERNGKRSPVGQMWFAGDTAFWNGALSEWATISLDAGGTFGVSLEPAAGAPEGNPAVLSADLGT
ncbi:MAG: anti-sigma factor [Chloroflexi bacterium]|nr:anti-sigma factor [Chloroflexota bacterium]